MKSYGSAGLEGILQQSYTVKINEYIGSGWKTFKKNPVGFAGFTLLFFLVNVAIAKVSQSVTLEGFISLLISAPLNAGFLIVAFKLLKKRATTFGDFFRGFNHYLPLFLVSLVSSLVIGIGLLLFLIPGLYLAVAYIFALPLVLERKMNFWAGMELSRKLISKQWFSFLGFALVLVLLNLAGVLLLGVGLLVTIPLSACAIAAAYADIVGLPASSADL
ncbi:glycerophosphoryl diester phosphodiesterase membrane domain-containing protein [Leptolyngbya sp. FACHB-321]|uniref:glycerophosphoryl diester phosphodiesterase membrane domain-containing protein n=1 Tax=Leptolyngbya sp. FACHB-321 TaxID=2692807 RepID=UPI0016832958|nr:glycerophosphoryl diester phosphodiesterase membrane domain-containing protein [Leptolyngbya sp. FACHB-321]MBD2034243.1 glycerophosphoryl diester phosphodiesterase membrane domain-containing protein [Leptolyngbya sp. FACHB-321]